MNEIILANIAAIKSRIAMACERSGRHPEDVQLLLATKTVSVEAIKIAVQSGTTLIAENRIQELKDKFDSLKDVTHTNHFIGHLQTNKIKELLRYNVSCVQSIDRLDLATKLSDRLQMENRNMDILIQVNTPAEESKFGLPPDEAVNFISEVSRLKNITIRGLMTIGLLSSETERVRECFQSLVNVQQQAIASGIPFENMKELSMGMSNDLEIAVEEGATIIRVGTAIFGKRNTPDSFYWDESGK